MATFNAYRKLQVKIDGYRKELDSHKQIEYAKTLLMNQQGLSEPEAYRTLRKMAMDRNEKLLAVAQNLIDNHQVRSL